MRGTHPQSAAQWRPHGITPAYAGNTVIRLRARGMHEDHPRICGEHKEERMKKVCILGSPPHMRGTLLPAFRKAAFRGITPAYAGNTDLSPRLPLRAGDHPRICGEHKRDFVAKGDILGSPPHMRGTLPFLPQSMLARGITPAYAGNTGCAALVTGQR